MEIPACFAHYTAYYHLWQACRIDRIEVIFMDIHVVQAGETLYSVAAQYGVTVEDVAQFNGFSPPYPLAVGQSVLILHPDVTANARAGDTVFSVAERFGVSATQILRNNPQLGGNAALTEGQRLVISLRERGTRSVEVSGYAYPFYDEATLRGILPYATYLSPFTYGISVLGELVELEDAPLVRLARQYGVLPLFHLSSLTEEGVFSSERAGEVLQSPVLQRRLAEALVTAMEAAGYRGLDVDFEYVGGENAAAYAQFVGFLRQQVNARGQELFTALAPKTSAGQAGVLYEGHDYAALGRNADAVLLMTYEWGYTYGPPLPVSPINAVRRVLDYAVTELPPSKVFLGFSNYGYDWTLPYVRGQSRAQSISNVRAVELAVAYGAEIQYDETARAPFFRYTEDGSIHEVWFEDARSAYAKLSLVPEYGFRGVGIWNFMRPFPTGFSLLHAMFDLVKG